MKRLEGKTAWITGAGSGIGRAIAISFAAEGAKVALTGRRTAPLEETAKMIGSGAVIVPADLTDEKQVAAALAKVESSIGGPDILVNNAGVNLPKRYLHQLTPDAIRSLVDGNLTAPFFTSVAVLPGMRKRGGGHIIQIASMAGRISPSCRALVIRRRSMGLWRFRKASIRKRHSQHPFLLHLPRRSGDRYPEKPARTRPAGRY